MADARDLVAFGAALGSAIEALASAVSLAGVTDPSELVERRLRRRIEAAESGLGAASRTARQKLGLEDVARDLQNLQASVRGMRSGALPDGDAVGDAARRAREAREDAIRELTEVPLGDE